MSDRQPRLLIRTKYAVNWKRYRDRNLLAQLPADDGPTAAAAQTATDAASKNLLRLICHS